MLARRLIVRFVIVAVLALGVPSSGAARTSLGGPPTSPPPAPPAGLPASGEMSYAQRAELMAREAGILTDPVYSRMKLYLPNLSPVTGLRFEMSLAPPVSDIPTDPYDLAKYGRLTLEYNDFMLIDGSRFGLAAQALHVAHHLLLYSAGITSDINCDGMFLITAGFAYYQTGNSRDEPFVGAPFIRVKFQSSERLIFLYSELEATMNRRAYISGTTGLGIRISPMMRLIGGYQHTEFLMPTEQLVRMVNGFQGTMQLGM